MGIWIRSQNRENLKFVGDIALCNTSEYVEGTNYPFDRKYKSAQIIAFDRDNTTLLGEYPTKERALQVLDDVQKLLCYDGYMQDSNYIVFEMPAE